jgi:hypothetical protein
MTARLSAEARNEVIRMGRDSFRSIRLAAVGFGTAILLAACQPAGSTQQPTAASPQASAAASMTIALLGEFHPVDAQASGVAELVQRADGGYDVVLDQFSIADTKDFTVALAMNRDVTSSSDVTAEEILELGQLKATSGMQAYPVPADMSAGVMDYHSVLIWDGAMGHVIAAAPLGQP